MNQALVEKLRSFYAVNEAARAFFDWAAQRQRNASETSLEAIEYRTGMDHSQAVTLGRNLSDIGICEFVSGRKGYKTRLRWHFSLSLIGLAAKGQKDVLSEELEEDWDGVDAVDADESNSDVSESLRPLTIPEAKRRLAITLDVDPSLIEITVKA